MYLAFENCQRRNGDERRSAAEYALLVAERYFRERTSPALSGGAEKIFCVATELDFFETEVEK